MSTRQPKPAPKDDPWLLLVLVAVLDVLWFLVKVLFFPIALLFRFSDWRKRRRWLREGKQRLAFISAEDVHPELRQPPPRRTQWRGPAVHGLSEDRAYYLDLLSRGQAVPAVVVFVERTQHEDWSSYEIAYVLRHRDGRFELVIDDNSAVTDRSRPKAMYRYRENLMWALNAQPGDVFTALINARGDHVLFETLQVFPSA